MRSSEYNRGYRGAQGAAVSLARELGGAFGERQWMEYGLCTQMDPDMFFAESREDTGFKDNGSGSKVAIQVCGMCKVKNLCLEYALQHPEELDGVWGGMAYPQRKLIRKARGTYRDPSLDVDEVEAERGDNAA